MIVQFSNVGRGKASFSADLHALNERTVAKAVKPYLMSRDIGFSVDFETRRGIVLAGVHSVGTFTWGEPDHPDGCICRGCRWLVVKKESSDGVR